MAITLDFTESADSIMAPIIKVHKILNWEGDYMPLPIADKTRVDSEAADFLMSQAESLWDEKAAMKKAAIAQGQAALNLITADESGEIGTKRTRRTNEYRRRNRQQKRQDEMLSKAETIPDEPTEEINIDDIDAFGAV